MAREKEAYRDNLEILLEKYPGKMMLNKTEVQKFTGLGYRKIVKMFPFKDGYISIATLARLMS